jgi:ABC-2 type transport system ATP-binding protein
LVTEVDVLRLDGLAKRYGDVVALDGCSFEVKPGQLVGFLGPNGAGKTTAMRSVFGLVRPDRGEVSWDAAPIAPDLRTRFGYMPEERGLYPRMRVDQQLRFFGELHGMDRTAADRAAAGILAELDLTGRATSRVEELSHGNQQRVQLAVALLHDPVLLVLDEPFAGLDPIGVSGLAAVLAARAHNGAAVVFSSHQLDLVEDLCEDVVIINRGRVVASGRVEELRAASPARYLEVVVPGDAGRWADGVAGVEVVERRGDRVRMLVREGTPLEKLARAAEDAGPVTEFRFEPPDLSEVFREVTAS